MSYLVVAQVISTRGSSKQVDGVFKARLSYPLKTQGVGWGTQTQLSKQDRTWRRALLQHGMPHGL